MPAAAAAAVAAADGYHEIEPTELGPNV